MIKAISILNELIQTTLHKVVITSITDNLDNTFTLTTSNTFYLNIGKKITIDSVSYVVTDFVLNESITVSPRTGTTPVTVLEFEIDPPTFRHGTPKAINNEHNKDNSYPFIWLVEFLDADYNDNFDARVKAVLDLNMLFLTDVNYEDWLVEDHYTNVIYPMANEVSFFIKTIQSRQDLFGEIQNHTVTNHVNFGEYIIDKGYETQIISDQLSGCQLKLSLPYVVDVCDCCTPIVSKCFPVSIYENDIFLEYVASGGRFDYVSGGGDATQIIEDSDNNILYTNIIPSGDVETQIITDSTVTNSDVSYNANILAQGSLILPDVNNIDSDGSTVPTPAQTPFICTPAISGGVENLDLINDVDFSTLANLDDFSSFTDGSTSISLDGGYLKISGTPATLLPVDNIIYNNYVTGLESWCFSFDFIIKSHSAGNEGIAIGFNSDSSSAILRRDLFYLYRNSASGLDGQVYFSRNNSAPTNFISNPITQNIDDNYRFTMTRTFQEFTIKIENLTLGEVESQTYTYDYSTSASPLTPRSSNLFIGHVGGTNWITNYKFKSNQKKNVNYLIVGDSITDGYSTDFWSQRWLDIVRNCQTQYTFTKSACQGDKVSTAVNKQAEFTLINSNKAILFIGTNQIISDGAGSALASYDTLYSNLQSLGITDFIHLNALPRAGSTQINTFNAGLLTRYGADVIDLNTYFNDGANNIKASLDSGDGVHPNIGGQRYIAEQVVNNL